MSDANCLEAWQAPAWLHAAPILEAAKVREEIRPDEGIEVITVHGCINVVASPYAKMHKDLSFPRWTLLWVLEGAGQKLSLAGRPVLSVPLTTGSLVLFDCHCAHWMMPARGRPVMYAAIFEFVARPSREECESRIREALALYAEAMANA